MSRVILAEKPSVAQAIAAALDVKGRKNGYMEDKGTIISWCFGHLAELASADTYTGNRGRWKVDELPIVPEKWEYTVAKDKAEQFAVLRELLNRADVTEVVNACDAGREGELIFRTVYYLSGCTKTMKRLWISEPSLRLVQWWMRPFARGSRTYGPAGSLTACITPRCAGREPIGWWESTEHGCFRSCIIES